MKLDANFPGLCRSTSDQLLFRFQRWLANLRVLAIDEIKSVPYVPLSHPYVGRLMGTIRREYLDPTFWNAIDLERKLNEFRIYYNAVRVHRSLEGVTPAQRANAPSPAPAALNHYVWRHHCRACSKPRSLPECEFATHREEAYIARPSFSLAEHMPHAATTASLGSASAGRPRMGSVDIVPFDAPLGAEVIGLDLAHPLDDATFARIHRRISTITCWCLATSALTRSSRSMSASASARCSITNGDNGRDLWQCPALVPASDPMHTRMVTCRPIAARLMRVMAVAAPLLLLTACSGVLDPKGPIGLADRTLLIDSLVIMLAIVVPTILVTFAFAWWYRASNKRARYLPDWEFSGRIELVVWSIPLMVILLLGGVAWIGAHKLDPYKPIESDGTPLEIEVVSLDWKWLFIYPDQGVASVNRLVVPAGRPLHFTLTSSSVWNAFFVPQLGSMIYTMNGMATQLYLQADDPGTYRGLSAHYSGNGFSDMNFKVEAMPQDQFAAWVATARADGPKLDAAAYTALAQQSEKVPPSTYKAVDFGLFRKIVTLQVDPAPGPPVGEHGAHQKPADPHGKAGGH